MVKAKNSRSRKTCPVSEDKVKEILKLSKAKKSVLILTQDNPDPDALASAAALAYLLEQKRGTYAAIAHGGVVGRAENRAMLRYLALELSPIKTVDLERFELVALVDTQPETGNNSLPHSRIADIVIDHHPPRKATCRSSVIDIRQDYGAASSILTEYLRAADLEPPTPLATALLYGIKSDTQDLGRDAQASDIDAFLYLYPLADKKILARIERGRVPAEYFRALRTAIYKARVHDTAISSNIGEIENPDMVAEVADLFLRLEGMEWAICGGVYQDELLVSLRTSNPQGNAHLAIKKAVETLGKGGGHRMMAAGRIPIGRRRKSKSSSQKRGASKEDRLWAKVEGRVLQALKLDGARARKLT